MKSLARFLALLPAVLLLGSERPPEPQGLWFEGEGRLGDVTQLTFGGQNAEAYWSPDGTRLIYQYTGPEGGCDQIWTMNADGSDKKMVSTGRGRTTCAYFVGTESIVYASTHHASPECPPEPDHSRGYVWPLYGSYEIWKADADGQNLVRLTENDSYDAEATLSPDGEWILFTSTRDGDIDLYKMRADGSEVTRLTDKPGYDGGAFFSPDGSKICWRASRPEGEVLAEYRALLAEGLVRPSKLDIYWMNADGTGVTRVTDNGAANFAPYFTPDSRRHSLRVQRRRSARPQLRSVAGEPGRHRDGAGHDVHVVRLVPDVQSGREEAGVRVQPERVGAGGDEHLHGGLGGARGGVGRGRVPAEAAPGFLYCT